MNNVHAIIFAEDAILIEYSTDSQSPFTQSIQLRIPYQVAQMHKQLADDMSELVQDAQTLLDSALMARVSGTRQTSFEEMGRT